ncbi:hypothetical protein IW262DRAFT_1292891 [Armillaria fumosa]|nr:hypothetical protein IW262DRAFT_1292891 [Armillaria fumosa]
MPLEWAENEVSYKQLPDIDGTVFVDGYFIIDGLRTVFPEAMVIAAPVEIKQLRERKSEGELELLKCATEATLLAIRHTHKHVHIGVRESGVARALVAAGLKDDGCLTLFEDTRLYCCLQKSWRSCLFGLARVFLQSRR